MSSMKPPRPVIWPLARRRRWARVGALLASLAALTAWGAPLWLASTPAGVEGLGGTWLVKLGKACGATAALLFLGQYLFTARAKFLDRVYGVERLGLYHRWLGVTVVVLATLHPMLVNAPLGLGPVGEIGQRWPEFLGAFLLICLGILVMAALARGMIGQAYHHWRLGHRILVLLCVVLLAGHVLNVSPDLQVLPARLAFLGLLAAWGLWFMWGQGLRTWMDRRHYQVQAARQLTGDLMELVLLPRGQREIAFSPGQFVFLRLFSQDLSPEEHPFTLAGEPRANGELVFYTRCVGDWTSRLPRVKSGDRAQVEGPYGLFSLHALDIPPERGVVMIAGGVGVTPMLSMLRQLAREGSPRPLTVIWCNRTRRDVFNLGEWSRLAEKLPGLKVHLIFTREPDAQGHLDQAALSRLLDLSRNTEPVFLCGPAGFMRQVRRHLKALQWRGPVLGQRFRL